MPLVHKSFFYKDRTLRDYDIFPKVMPKGKTTEIFIKANGCRSCFRADRSYSIGISEIAGGNRESYPKTAYFVVIPAKTGDGSHISFTHTFPREGEYYIQVLDENGKWQGWSFEMSVYCVAEDLVGRYPYLGDLHVHTCCSDGHEEPEEVCAAYHSHGYDFMVISDHHRYYPSVRAMNYYKELKTELLIVPGEEVHPLMAGGLVPNCHIVNFGGRYSVNGLVTSFEEKNPELINGDKYRTLDGKGDCPPVMTDKEFDALITESVKGKTFPEGVDPMNAGIYKWVADSIRDAGGLCIFAHPYWRYDSSNNVSDAFCDYLRDNKLFDAFEVLGGELYYEQNGYQTARYYNDRAMGYNYPVVGSTDSHDCWEESQGSMICSTLVFSTENSVPALVSSIKDFYSVALDTLNAQTHVVGDFRLVRYANFLVGNYLPIHDEYCYESGRLMHQYYVGDEAEKAEAKALLDIMYGRLDRLRKKYFAF